VNDGLATRRDTVLQTMAERLRGDAQLRLVARIGGDEFTVLVQNLAARRCAARGPGLLDGWPPLQGDEHEFSLSASAGISVYPTTDRRATLLRNADLRCTGRSRKGRTLTASSPPNERACPRAMLLLDSLRAASTAGS